MNLDKLVRAGQPPWYPVPEAEDVWDKFDFPSSGTYRLDGALVMGIRSRRAGCGEGDRKRVPVCD
jgi:hypothetical protein